MQTWVSVIGLLKLREFVITVDHFSIWRRHLAWAVENGKDLREYMTQRYASSMVFMSLLLATELNVLFNSARVTTNVRDALMHEAYRDIHFWAGIAVIISAILTLLSLISIFTAWTSTYTNNAIELRLETVCFGLNFTCTHSLLSLNFCLLTILVVVSAVSEANAHCIFRSAIGQYVAELPGRYIVGSIYSFLIWICLFFFILLPLGFWSILLLVLVIGLFVHTIAAFSAFGRVIMHTGAMGDRPIFEKHYESSLLPHTLHNCLLIKARANLGNKTSIMRQYLSKSKPIAQFYGENEMADHLSDRSHKSSSSPTDETPVVRRRTESLVKFADGFDTNGERYGDTVQSTPRNREIQIQNNPGAVVSPLPMGSSHRPPLPSLARKQSADATPANSATSLFGRSPPSFAEQWLRPPSDRHLSIPNVLDDDPGDLEQQAVGALLASTENDAVPVDNPYLFHGATFTAPASEQDDVYSRSTSVSSMDRLQYDGATELSEDDERFAQDYGDLFDGEDDFASGGDNSDSSSHRPIPDSREMSAGSGTGDNAVVGGERAGLLDSNESRNQEYYYSTQDNDEAGFL